MIKPIGGQLKGKADCVEALLWEGHGSSPGGYKWLEIPGGLRAFFALTGPKQKDYFRKLEKIGRDSQGAAAQ